MDGTLSTILADDLYARLGTATAPIVLDVRRSDAFNADDRVIVSAAHCDVTREQQWLDGLAAAKAVVVYCADGGAISQAAAAVLRTAGIPTTYLEYPMEHQVAMESLQDGRAWLAMVLAGERPDEAVPEDPVELVPSVTTAAFDGEVLKSDVPVIVDFVVHPDAMVWPMVAAGASNDQIQFARGLSPTWDREDD